MTLYVINDNIALESGPVFEAKNDAVAMRNYQQLVLKTAGIQPGDFSLYRVGEINHETNIVTSTYPELILTNLGMNPENLQEDSNG